MLTEERFKYILNKLDLNGTVKIKDLIDEIGVSESTVRRDFDELEKDGMLKRVHGGAVSVKKKLIKDHSISHRKEQFNSDKKIIGEYCGSLVEDGDVIYLDSGTTTYEIIPFLSGKNITVVTNGVYNADRLIEYDISTILLGGYIKKITKTIVGDNAYNQLKDMRFSKCFVGANGVSLEYGITTPDIRESNIKRLAIKNTTNPYVVVDKSKFKQVSFSKICEFEDVSIITNAKENEIEPLKELTEIIKL